MVLLCRFVDLKQAADSSPWLANANLNTPLIILWTNKCDHPPVFCYHCGIVADTLDPGGSASGQIGHIRVGVVVDPSPMTISVVGKDAPNPCGC